MNAIIDFEPTYPTNVAADEPNLSSFDPDSLPRKLRNKHDATMLGIFLALCGVVTVCFIVGIVATVLEIATWFG
jgi:hypothetical protein